MQPPFGGIQTHHLQFKVSLMTKTAGLTKKLCGLFGHISRFFKSRGIDILSWLIVLLGHFF